VRRECYGHCQHASFHSCFHNTNSHEFLLLIGNYFILQVPLEVIHLMKQYSELEMKNVVQEILSNIKKAQNKYEKKSFHGDSQHPRTKCPGGRG